MVRGSQPVERLNDRPSKRLFSWAGTPLGVVCLVLFMLMNISDWPGGFLNTFWLNHAIIGASAGTLLLGATVFLVYRHRDQQAQNRLAESIVDAGQSGLVEQLVNIDVALSLLCAQDESPLCAWPDWNGPGRPLRWLNERRYELLSTQNYRAKLTDPRALVPSSVIQMAVWRVELIRQMIRRISSGVKEWGPIMMQSRQGQRELVTYARLRVVLLHVEDNLCSSLEISTAPIVALQQEVRALAWRLELEGQAPSQRVELVEPEWAVRPPAGSHRLARLRVLLGKARPPGTAQVHLTTRQFWTGDRAVASGNSAAGHGVVERPSWCEIRPPRPGRSLNLEVVDARLLQAIGKDSLNDLRAVDQRGPQLAVQLERVLSLRAGHVRRAPPRRREVLVQWTQRGYRRRS